MGDALSVSFIVSWLPRDERGWKSFLLSIILDANVLLVLIARE